MQNAEQTTETIPTMPIEKLGEFFGGFGDFVMLLNSIWNGFAIFSFLVSGFFIFGIVYAMLRSSQLGDEEDAYLREQEKKFAQLKGGGPKNSRWEDVLMHIDSPNPNDWRLAIIEADIILEEALDEMGLAGTTIGDKLKSASPTQMTTLDAAWQAHRVRNQIAHAGSDFVLTQKLAQDTISQFRMVFNELGKI